jgi:hypothetical protein
MGEAGPEAVVPLDKMPMGNTIKNYFNIEATIRNDMDIDDLANQLGDYIERQLKKV